MDKYEFNIKVEKMKKAVDRKDYLTAAKVADSINWERSTNAKVLMMIAQIYEKQERYTEARSALTEVYNRVPVGKRIVYKLTELAVKCNDIDEALDLYHEYQEIAPTDPSKLILAYKIATARGDDLEKRISILEAYRRRDFDEKWAYELATLYQQAGRGADCVAICDEIILWFGVGPYVDRAMTLKVAYAPLTPEQEEKRAHKDYYEQKLAEVAAASSDTIQVSPEEAAEQTSETESDIESEDTDVPETDESKTASSEVRASSDFPVDAPSVSPVVKEAELHMTMEQELAQAIQSTSDELTPETDANEWVTDKPMSVDRVGEDVDGQYTLFRTVAEENEDVNRPEHTRTFSFGALLTKTRRLDSLRDLAELNGSLAAAEPVEEPETPVQDETDGNVPSVDTAAETPEEASVSVSAEKTVAAPEKPSVSVPVEETTGTSEKPSVSVPAEETNETPEDAPTEETDEIAGEPTPKNNYMIFCHVLKLNDDTPAVAQIKDAFRQAHQVSGIPAASIARVGIEKINRAGLTAALNKLQGRDLLLENAGELSESVIEQLLLAVEEPPCTAVILLADCAEGVSKLYRKAPTLFPLSAEIPDEEPEEEPAPEELIAVTAAEDEAADTAVPEEDEVRPSDAEIPEQLASESTEAPAPETSDDEDEENEPDDDDFEGFASFVPKEFENQSADGQSGQTSDTAASDRQTMSPDEFSAFIHEYALENDCKFDSMAELALAARIDRLELSGAPMDREAAVELVERAIDKAERFTFKSIFISRYDKEGYLIIKEAHIN